MSYPFYPSSICTSCWYGGYLEPTLTPVGCRTWSCWSQRRPSPSNGLNNTQSSMCRVYLLKRKYKM